MSLLIKSLPNYYLKLAKIAFIFDKFLTMPFERINLSDPSNREPIVRQLAQVAPTENVTATVYTGAEHFYIWQSWIGYQLRPFLPPAVAGDVLKIQVDNIHPLYTLSFGIDPRYNLKMAVPIDAELDMEWETPFQVLWDIPVTEQDRRFLYRALTDSDAIVLRKAKAAKVVQDSAMQQQNLVVVSQSPVDSPRHVLVA